PSGAEWLREDGEHCQIRPEKRCVSVHPVATTARRRNLLFVASCMVPQKKKELFSARRAHVRALAKPCIKLGSLMRHPSRQMVRWWKIIYDGQHFRHAKMLAIIGVSAQQKLLTTYPHGYFRGIQC